MGAGERKLGVGMIKKRRLPGIRGVALGAIGAEIVLHVVRVAHPGIIGLVTGVAIRGGVIVAIGVAVDTL